MPGILNPMKLNRLLRPSDPRFWLLLAFNGASAAVSWVLQSRDLPTWLQVVFAVFAVANFLLGLRLAHAMVRDPPARAASKVND